MPLVVCGILGNVEQCVLAAAQSKHSKGIYLQDLGGGGIDTILDLIKLFLIHFSPASTCINYLLHISSSLYHGHKNPAL